MSTSVPFESSHWKINISVKETESPCDFSNKSNLVEGIDYTGVSKAGKSKREKGGFGEANSSEEWVMTKDQKLVSLLRWSPQACTGSYTVKATVTVISGSAREVLL